MESGAACQGSRPLEGLTKSGSVSSYREIHYLLGDAPRTAPTASMQDPHHKGPDTSIPSETEDLRKYDFIPKLRSTGLSTIDSSNGDGSRVDSPSVGDDLPSELHSSTQVPEHEELGAMADGRTPLQVGEATCTVLHTALQESKIMDDHDSYHEEISGEEAVRRLRMCSNHGYLTRYKKTSSREDDTYILTVFRNAPSGEVIRHFKIIFDNGPNKVYRINDRKFGSLQEMLDHYEQHRIDPALKKIGKAVTENDYVQKLQKENAQQLEAKPPDDNLVVPVRNAANVPPEDNPPAGEGEHVNIDMDPRPQGQIPQAGQRGNKKKSFCAIL